MSKRIEYLRAHFQAAAEDKIRGSFGLLLDADPTPNKKYSQWLIGQFLQDRISFSDLPSLSDEIWFYERHKGKLSIAYRDINKIANPSQIAELVRPFVDKKEWLTYLEKHHKGSIEAKANGAFEHISEAYTRHTKESADWYLRLFMHDKLLLEDMPKVLRYIGIFEHRLNEVDEASRDMNAHKNWQDLFDTIDPFMVRPKWVQDEATILRDNEFLANGGINILGGNAEYRLLHIKNRSAAIYYGQDTEWCTSFTTERNWFGSYRTDLLMLQMKDGRRFQLHFGKQQYQDETDAAIDLAALCRSNSGLAELLAPFAENAVGRALTKGEFSSVTQLIQTINTIGAGRPQLVKAIGRSLKRLQKGKFQKELIYAPIKVDQPHSEWANTDHKLCKLLEQADAVECNLHIRSAVGEVITASAKQTIAHGAWDQFVCLAAAVARYQQHSGIHIPTDLIATSSREFLERQWFGYATDLMAVTKLEPTTRQVIQPILPAIAQGIIDSRQVLQDGLYDNRDHEQRRREGSLYTGLEFIGAAKEISEYGEAIGSFLPVYAAELMAFRHLDDYIAIGFLETAAHKPEWLSSVPENFVNTVGNTLHQKILSRMSDRTAGFLSFEFEYSVRLIGAVAGSERLAAALPKNFVNDSADALLSFSWERGLDSPTGNCEMASPRELAKAVRGTTLAQTYEASIIKKLESLFAEEDGWNLRNNIRQAVVLMNGLRDDAKFPIRAPQAIVARVLERAIVDWPWSDFEGPHAFIHAMNDTIKLPPYKLPISRRGMHSNKTWKQYMDRYRGKLRRLVSELRTEVTDERVTPMRDDMSLARSGTVTPSRHLG